MKNRTIQLLRSKQINEDNQPLAPSPSQLADGELAINYATNYETIFFKNDSDNIVSFKDEIWIKNYISRLIITPPSDTNFLEVVYPIGSIYISTIATNPSELFGFGVWERIEDTFLLASGSKYAPGSTGGESEHTLTTEELPEHTHTFYRHQLWDNETIEPAATKKGYGVTNKTINVYIDNTSSVGSNQAHNNMPPYLAVYVWKRNS